MRVHACPAPDPRVSRGGDARLGATPPIQGHESTTPAAEIIEKARELHTVVCGYRIGPLLGRGGLSVVLEVTHAVLGGLLAMKVVTDPRIQDDLAVDAIYIHAREDRREAPKRTRGPHL